MVDFDREADRLSTALELRLQNLRRSATPNEVRALRLELANVARAWRDAGQAWEAWYARVDQGINHLETVAATSPEWRGASAVMAGEYRSRPSTPTGRRYRNPALDCSECGAEFNAGNELRAHRVVTGHESAFAGPPREGLTGPWDSRTDRIVRQTLNTGVPLPRAVRDIARDVEPISREIGVPPNQVLRRLGDKYGYRPPLPTRASIPPMPPPGLPPLRRRRSR
jgi:hypothetical protein